MFSPSYRTSPRVGSMSLIKSRARVDLPLPLSPTTARISPRLTVRSTSSSALNQDRFLPSQPRSEEHTSELQSLAYLVCRLLLEKKKKNRYINLLKKTKKNKKLN